MEGEKNNIYICPDCESALATAPNGQKCPACGREFLTRDDILVLLPKILNPLSREEAEYHDSLREDAAEIHQLNAWRNFFYHQSLRDKIRENARKGGRLLEIAAGSGNDARYLADDYDLVLTDISIDTLRAAKAAWPSVQRKTEWVVCEGGKPPFCQGCFDGMYLFAALHHLSDPKEAVEKWAEILAPGGILSIGFEPNSFYFSLIKKMRRPLCWLTGQNSEEGSKADREMVGFGKKDLRKFFADEKWENVEIQPVWFLAGFLHYGLEMFFRVFRLKKRLLIPLWLEKKMVVLDERIFDFPFFHFLGWHWFVSARRR